MKKHFIKSAFLLGFGLSLNLMPIANANTKDKACVYTVDTPDSYRLDCFGAGSMCSNVLACPTIRLPKI